MSGITLVQAQRQLDLWLEADAVVSTRQSYTINGRQLTKVDASEITQKIIFWSNKVKELSGGGLRGVATVDLP